VPIVDGHQDTVADAPHHVGPRLIPGAADLGPGPRPRTVERPPAGQPGRVLIIRSRTEPLLAGFGIDVDQPWLSLFVDLDDVDRNVVEPFVRNNEHICVMILRQVGRSHRRCLEIHERGGPPNRVGQLRRPGRQVYADQLQIRCPAMHVAQQLAASSSQVHQGSYSTLTGQCRHGLGEQR
jgi:hypothetical protein